MQPPLLLKRQDPILYLSAVHLMGMQVPSVAGAQTGNPIYFNPERISGISTIFDQIPLQLIISSAAKL